MQINPSGFSGQALAYFGDAVIELLVRERLLKSGIGTAGALNKAALAYVTAGAQSRALGNILPLLDEEEEAAFKRGRNNHLSAIPKRASAAEYRRATGLEALFGMLWLAGREERARALFALAYPEEPAETLETQSGEESKET